MKRVVAQVCGFRTQPPHPLRANYRRRHSRSCCAHHTASCLARSGSAERERPRIRMGTLSSLAFRKRPPGATLPSIDVTPRRADPIPPHTLPPDTYADPTQARHGSEL